MSRFNDEKSVKPGFFEDTNMGISYSKSKIVQ